MTSAEQLVLYNWQNGHASLVASQLVAVAWLPDDAAKEIIRKSAPRIRMNPPDKQEHAKGPILAVDLGHKRVGLAVSDELLISITRLKPLSRTNWKQLLRDVAEIIDRQNAKALVVGFPLSLDGTKGSAAEIAQQTAKKFAQSLSIPVFLQDERLTSVAAAEQLRAGGHNPKEVRQLIDSEAAAVILADFIGSEETRTHISREGND